MRSTTFKLILIFIFATFPAHAYTDPGSGAMMVQILIGAFVGAGFYVRKIIRYLRPKSKDRV